MDATLTIGEVLARARKRRGVSQRELAARIGIHQPTLAQLERGRHIPTIGTVQRICGALACCVLVDGAGCSILFSAPVGMAVDSWAEQIMPTTRHDA